MFRALPAVLSAVAVAVAAHLLGVASLMTVVLGVLAAGAISALRALQTSRFVLSRSGTPIVARADLAGVVGSAFPVFTAWIVANVVLNPDVFSAVYGPAATSNYSPVLVLVLLPLLALTGLFVVIRAPRSLPRAPRVSVVLAIVLVVLLGVKVAIGWGLLKVPGFDSGIVLLAAYHQVFPDAITPPYDSGLFATYFGWYPNNLVLGGFFTALFSVAHAVGLEGFHTYFALALVVNCLALTIVELLSFLVARRLWGTRTAFFALAVTAAFTTLSPWLNTPYSDTLGMLFPIGLLYVWLRLRGAHGRPPRLAFAVGFGVVAALGIALKPTILFAVVAIVLVEFVRSRRAFRRKLTLVAAASVAGLALVSGVGTSLALTAATNGSGLVRFDVWTYNGGAPITHFMKMGAHGTGGFDFADVQSTFAVPQPQRAGAALQVYQERVAAMGPEGYVSFLGEKALRTFADGSFFWGQEGENYPDWFFSDPYSLTIRQWWARDGVDHVYLASLWQAAWILLLAAASLPVARFATAKGRRTIDTARLAMLALLCFQLLFETRSRYVYLYVPFVVVMAVGAFHALPAALTDLRARWRPRAARRRPVPRAASALVVAHGVPVRPVAERAADPEPVLQR